jgi:hypothetical protein
MTGYLRIDDARRAGTSLGHPSGSGTGISTLDWKPAQNVSS